MDSIDKLKELTNGLPEIPRLEHLVKGSATGTVEYSVEGGYSFGVNLLNRPEVAVMELFIKKGTGFPEHMHEDEMEWGVIYSGKLEVVVDGEKTIVNPGEAGTFGKGHVHSTIALEDTRCIMISIPRIAGYPTD